MKMKITFSPTDIRALIDAEVRRRGYEPLSKAKVLTSTHLEGFYTGEHEVTSFNGVEIDVDDAPPLKLTKLPDYGELIPMEKGELFTDCFDGSGYWATDTGYSRAHRSGLPRPEWATHVMYFSK